MSIKKYSSGQWVDIPYRKYETATDTITSLPKTIYGDGQNISTYTIKGNMTQSGMPTPTSPIYPSECGDLVSSGQHSGEYVLPIVSGGVTTNVYLSEPIRKISTYADECPSTGTASRAIRKWVLTGSENWSIVNSGTANQYFYTSAYAAVQGNEICSHFIKNDIFNGNTNVGIMVVNAGGIRIRPENVASISLTDFTTWLTTQNSNGTPVTVWYVLATATTETFTSPSIPTSGTAESFDVDTALKPSEVSLTYHGWHEHSDTKFT